MTADRQGGPHASASVLEEVGTPAALLPPGPRATSSRCRSSGRGYLQAAGHAWSATSPSAPARSSSAAAWCSSSSRCRSSPAPRSASRASRASSRSAPRRSPGWSAASPTPARSRRSSPAWPSPPRSAPASPPSSGAMRISDEIDALEVMSVPTLVYLVCTRVVAAFICIIPLYLFSLFASFFATELVTTKFFGLSPGHLRPLLPAVPAADRRLLQPGQGVRLRRRRRAHPLLLRLLRHRRPGGRRRGRGPGHPPQHRHRRRPQPRAVAALLGRRQHREDRRVSGVRAERTFTRILARAHRRCCSCSALDRLRRRRSANGALRARVPARRHRSPSAGQGLHPAVRREDPRRQHRPGQRASSSRDGRALVRMDIDSGEKVPVDAKADHPPEDAVRREVRRHRPRRRRGDRAVPRATSGDDHATPSAASSSSRCSPTSIRSSRRSSPRSSATVLDTLAAGGEGLGPTVNRTIAELRRRSPTSRPRHVGRHAAVPRRPGPAVATSWPTRADDLIAGASDLNGALPDAQRSAATSWPPCLDQAARLSGDVADMLEANRPFLDKAVTEGGKTARRSSYDDRARSARWSRPAPVLPGARPRSGRIAYGDGTKHGGGQAHLRRGRARRAASTAAASAGHPAATAAAAAAQPAPTSRRPPHRPAAAARRGPASTASLELLGGLLP